MASRDENHPRIMFDGEAETENRELGMMRVSIERGLLKRIDVRKVAGGRFLTQKAGWLVRPVREFIADRLGRVEQFLDPFAGDGHLLDLCAGEFGLPTAGYDIESNRWPSNDSLLRIPPAPGAMIVTNPPYLARHSARRKGVLQLSRDYFEKSGRDDLYKIAIDRCLEASELVVAIVPETIVLSDYPKDRIVLLAVIQEQLFTDTAAPVVVACFDRAWQGRTAVYVDDEPVGELESLLEMRQNVRPHGRESVRIRFNDPNGRIGLQAVDGVSPHVRIRFMPAAEFGYSAAGIKHSSRLMTYIDIPDLPEASLPAVIARANELTEAIRRESRDIVLAPFKGNNKAGIRRRRLDYALARGILLRSIALCLADSSATAVPGYSRS